MATTTRGAISRTPRSSSASRYQSGKAGAATVRPRQRAVQATGERVFRICFFLCLLYLALACRLFFLQVYRHEEFVEQARAIREKSMPLPAQRGVLYDRGGMLLVRNEPAYDITLDPNMWYAHTNPAAGDTPQSREERAIEGLEACLPGTNIRAILQTNPPKQVKTANGSLRYRTITVARQVDVATGEKIKALDLMGVGTPGTSHREAVDGDLASHVLGFTGRDGKGLAGLEHGLDGELAGENGRIAAEFDSHGREIPGTVRSRQAVQQGRDIVLTLDADLQHQVQQTLIEAVAKHHAEAGTAIVLDPHTGDILALANCPTYNVNNVAGASPAARIDRAVAAPYEPGSTLKVVTIAAALEEKKVTPDSTFYCAGSSRIGKRTIHCALEHPFEHGHGEENLLQVIQNSCNVATAQCAFRLGKQTLYRYERMFGFGDRTDSGLPGESRGLLRPVDNWSDIQLANVAFGQGISVTPLQLAAAYAAIANDGVYLRPRIVLGDRDPETEAIHPDAVEQGRRVVSPQTAGEIRRMLEAVVENGTGRPAQLDGYTAGGKTGTAQIAEGGHYGGKFVASFIGMAPMTAPKYVVLVAITAPQGDHYGGSVSGPVFKEIMEKALLAARVPHDKAPDPTDKKRRKRGGDARAEAVEA